MQAADALQYKMDDSQRKYRKERAIRIVLAETLSPVDTVFDAVLADFTSGMKRTVRICVRADTVKLDLSVRAKRHNTVPAMCCGRALRGT